MVAQQIQQISLAIKRRVDKFVFEETEIKLARHPDTARLEHTLLTSLNIPALKPLISINEDNHGNQKGREHVVAIRRHLMITRQTQQS